jgi:hypothetical protein|tara:strand:+ start:28616 stop:28999 length:384 start_codon:yes stop_codon:yes gene_type:complete
MSENENEEYETKDGINIIFDKVLKTIKTFCYSAAIISFVGLATAWFMYDVEGKPMSTHSSEVGIKLVKQLATDGYLSGAKVLFTEKKYCVQHGEYGDECITKEEQKALDTLIDRALFNGGPDGITKK